MNIQSLAPCQLPALDAIALEQVAQDALAVIYSAAEPAAKQHAGLLLHYARDFQAQVAARPCFMVTALSERDLMRN